MLEINDKLHDKLFDTFYWILYYNVDTQISYDLDIIMRNELSFSENYELDEAMRGLIW